MELESWWKFKMSYFGKILITMTLLFSLACGVKNDPVNPTKNTYPSVMQEVEKKIKKNYYGESESDHSSR